MAIIFHPAGAFHFLHRMSLLYTGRFGRVNAATLTIVELCKKMKRTQAVFLP